MITNLKDINVKHVLETDKNFVEYYEKKLIDEIRDKDREHDKELFQEEYIQDRDFVDESNNDKRESSFEDSLSDESDYNDFPAENMIID